LPRFAAAAVAGDVAARTRELAEPGERTEAELLAIATERRGLLRELIPADPGAALACRLTYAQRRALPEAVAAQLETPVDAHGQLEVIAVCGPQTGGTERFVTTGVVRWRAFLAGARVQSVSQERMPVHGIAIDDIMAVAAEPYRWPDPGELMAEVSAVEEGITVLVGEERRVFAAKEELDEWADRTRAAETILPSVFGQRKILFVMVDFSDAPGAPTTEAELLKSMDSVNTYYKDMSANRLSFTTTVLPAVLRLPQMKAVYNSDSNLYQAFMTDSLAVLAEYDARSGGNSVYAQNRFQHILIVSSDLSNWSWAGKASQPGVRVHLNGSIRDGVIAHELGHNLGVSHAYAWKASGVSPIGSGAHLEYGDLFDVMGLDQTNILKNCHLCTPKKRALGFIADGNLISVQASGEFRIYRHDADIGSRIVGLKIDAGTAYDYWVEYRKLPPTGLSDYAEAMTAGVQLRWNKLPAFTKAEATGTYLLDMTPGSAGDMKDSMLTLGNSFYDPNYKIRITPLRTGSSTEGDWIDVAVVLGDNPTNRPPVVQSAAAAETAFARVPVNLSAKANDADGNAVLYQWDLGDGKPVYSTDGTVQKLWATGGTYSATVRAFDIYGGESRQTFQIRVEDPATSWVRATVPGLGTETLHAVCFGGGKFVAVGGFVACVSSDGKQWTKSSTGTSTMYAYAAAFGGSRYVAVGSSWSFSSQSYSTGIFYSSDGLAWSTASTVRSERLNSVTYGGGRFVAVGDSGIIWSSSDGQTWGVTQLISKKTLRGVAWSGTEFLAAGDSGTAIYSRDGANWFDASLSDSNTDASAVSWIKDTDATAVVSRYSGWYVISNWRYSDLSAGVSWSSASLGRWTGVARTYMPFEYYPSLAPFAAGSSLMTFPSTSATSAASLATSLDGVAWSSTTIGADGSGPLRGGIEGNGRIVVVGNRGQIYYSADGPPALARQPQTQTVNVGARASLSVTAYATGPFTYQWRKNGSAISGATADTLVFSSSAVSDSGDYSVAVTNSRGVVLSAVATLTVRPAVSAPVIVAAPASRVLTQGATSQLSVTASGTPAPTYQWFKDGSSIPGATGSTYSLTADGSASGGSFSVEVTNSAGRVTSSAASVRVIPTNRLANLSVRTGLESGQTLIVGAVVAEGTKGLLVRAAGPALNQFGLSGLPNPSMDLYTGGAQPAASNDDWNATLAPLFQTAGAFGFVVGSKDSALNPTIGGAFTVQVKGSGAGSVLVEAYDLGAETSPRLVNLSARHWVGTGADVLIAGFVVGGTGTKQVLIRAVGPTLASFGVAGALADPQLEVLDGGGRSLGSNDNWSAVLSSTFGRVGAFPLLSGSRDAAALVTLTAGASYTVKVSGVNNTTGEALIEVYEVF
jgi:M6 family metalloprotease-like protein